MGQRIDNALALKVAGRSWVSGLVVFVELMVSSSLFQFRLPLSDHIQRSDHIAQRVCRHADSSCEKKERCDDHSDPDESELATSPAFSVFWMRNRKNLDEESDHVATGGQHHHHSKAHEGFFESAEAPGSTLGLLGNGEITQKCQHGDGS